MTLRLASSTLSRLYFLTRLYTYGLHAFQHFIKPGRVDTRLLRKILIANHYVVFDKVGQPLSYIFIFHIYTVKICLFPLNSNNQSNKKLAIFGFSNFYQYICKRYK